MKSNIKRLLSMALVLVMVLSLVPATVFASEGDSAAYAAQNVATGAQYADLNQAISEAQPGQIVKALADAQNVVYGNEGVILDLNGYDLSLTASEGVTVSAIDSATDDYEGEYGSLTTDGKVATTVKTGGEVKSYVTIAENGSYSFHRYYAAIAAISLKPSQVALGYRAEFRGDEAVKNAVVNYGYELWVNNGAHKTYTRTDALTKSSLTLRLQNIMAEGNETLNAIGSSATIGGNAFVTLELNGEQVKLSGTEKETTLRQVVESVNANANRYGEAQLEPVRTMITTYAAWMEGWNTDAIFGKGEAEGDGSDLDVEITVDVNAEGGVLTEDAVLSSDDITVTVPQGTVLEEGTKQLVLTISKKASSDSGIAEEEGYSLLPLDVHIAGIAADNTTPIIVGLGEVLPKALNIGNYELYHVENGETVEMTRVYSVSELDAHNEFYYDPATGAVTVAMASFSEVALRNTAAQWTGGSEAPVQNGDTYYIYNADQLQGLSDLVANGTTFAGDTVILMADITFAGETEDESLIFYPIGHYYKRDADGNILYETNGNITYSNFQSFEGTFDGNGHTISNLYQQTWAMIGDYNSGYTAGSNYYKDGMGLFGYVVGGTVKNLTIDKFVSVGEFAPTGCIAAYAKGNCTFENISLRNCHPATYNTGVAGIVGWDDGGDDETEAEKTHYIYKNITIDETNEIEALWGSWDVAAAGLQGYLAPYSTAYLENCHLAPTINVYNDVCGNYQYYWYRYCGMFIGTVDKTDANGVLDLSNITAKNCTADFGDRHEYYYCEFVKNSIASYTHDYQFSRVNNADITVTNGVPACNHDHEARGTQQINGNTVLVEDKQAVYIPFRQLFGGYGWGVDGVDEYENIEITTLNASAVKFESVLDNTNILTDSIMTIGQLFKVKDGVTLDIDNVQVFISPANESSTAGGTYVANTENWAEGTLTFSGEGAAEIIITDYYFCVETKLIVNVATPVVRFHAYNNTLTTATGNTVNLVDPTTCPNGYTFVGWSKTPLAEETDKKPTTISGETYTPTAATTNLYAVYSRTETTEGETTASYEKVTSTPDKWSGTYLIVYEDGNVAFNGGLTTLDAVSNTIAVTISNGTIESNATTNAAAFTIDDNGHIKSASGYYIGQTSNANGLKSSATTEYSNTLSINNDESVNVVSGGAYLRYNATSGQYRFRYYKSSSYTGQKAIHLYMYTETKTEGSSTTYYITYEVTCQHTNTTTTTVDATCTTAGSTVVTCDDCGETVSTETIAALGHDWSDWTQTVAPGCETVGEQAHTCSVCGQTETESIAATGHYYNENNVCSVCGNEKAAGTLVTDIDTITMGGGFVIVAESSGKYYALDTTIDNKIAAVEVTVTDGMLDTTSNVPVWNIMASGNGIALKNDTHYLKWSSSTSFGFDADPYVWKIAASETENAFNITPSGTSARQIALNSTPAFGTYATSNTGYVFDLYIFAVDPCSHANATTTTVNATCTTAGYTQVSCPDCERTWISSETPALGHSTPNGVCSNCGETLATLSFASTAQRTSFSTSKQVWEQNGITFTNNKAASTNNVADYSNPVRLYANSEVIITFTQNITSIEFVCSEGIADLVNSINIEGATVTVSGNTVIVTLDGTFSTVTIASLAAQIRLTSITVSYKA